MKEFIQRRAYPRRRRATVWGITVAKVADA